jgi:hypothetical protein
VCTSAPGGSDWNCKVCAWADVGFGLNQSGLENDEPEHPASAPTKTAAEVVMTNPLCAMAQLG